MPFGEEIGDLSLPAGTPQPRTAAHGYTNADTIRQKFTGYERDIEVDLDFAQARYYNFKHGRFTSVDPLTASADIANPQTFNRYAYVGNNPINITDPTGEIWGVKDGTVQWFDTEDAMKAAGSTAYTLLYAFRTGTNQMVALNANANVAVNVASAAQWLSQQVSWGATAEILAPGAAALAGVPVAAAALALGEILDPAGRYRTGQNLPEPVRDFAGTKQSYWDEFLTALSKRQTNESTPTSINTQWETTPATPDPNDNKPSKAQSGSQNQQTPATNPDRFESVRGQPAKRDRQTGEIWVFDRLHKNHYEVYKNWRDYERGRRSRSVWTDGRLKETF
jgi:RHS repeat-associated protein